MKYLLLLLLLAGCATTRPVLRTRCETPIPARPSMPTDSVALTAPLDTKVRAATAEIVLREGYEGELVAALESCR